MIFLVRQTPDASAFAVILAGVHGEPFWRLNSKTKPKHHLTLFSKRTLLSATLDRLGGFIPVERTLMLTVTEQAAAARPLLRELPAENFVVEPMRRDTAAAMALSAGMIARCNPRAVAVVATAASLTPIQPIAFTTCASGLRVHVLLSL